MENTKYLCPDCAEEFTILGREEQGPAVCPRCGSQDIPASEYCSLEAGPPPWEFECETCKVHFKVKSPSGPDEVAALACPVCRSKKLKWLALSTAACGTGG